MFSLLAGFYEYVFRKAEFQVRVPERQKDAATRMKSSQVLLLGLDRGGKTNLLECVKASYVCKFPLVPLSQITAAR
jgi:hypothetical protein